MRTKTQKSANSVRHDGVVAPIGSRPVRRWVRARPGDVIDLFVYVVVLNLAIEYVPSVISESFTLSMLTAVLLKVALEIVIVVKSAIVGRHRAATTRRAKVGAVREGGRGVPSVGSRSGKQACRPRAGRLRVRRCRQPRRIHPGDTARLRPTDVACHSSTDRQGRTGVKRARTCRPKDLVWRNLGDNWHIFGCAGKSAVSALLT